MAARKAYGDLAGRYLSARQQSPGIGSGDQRVASGTELNKVFGKPSKRDESEAAIYNALAAQPGEEVHHMNILETIAPGFKGLNEQEAFELAGMLEARGYALGNQLRNLINMPVPAHKDLHKITKSLGAEIDMNRGKFVGKMDPLLKSLIDAGDVPSLRYRADMIGNYLDKFNPILRKAQDEVLTMHTAAGAQGPRPGNEYLRKFLADYGVTLAGDALL
tara:strand:- start:369 stop:1025 length:657 start_codon:yes stop_codon:yes gene_type:complete